MGTPLNPQYSCAIALLQVEGKTPEEVHGFLWRNHKIHAVSIIWENIKGVRVTPNVYTTLNDLDRLVRAIADLQQQK